MELITHPQGLLTSGVIARDQAYAAIGGHAEAVEAVIVKGFKMGFLSFVRNLGRFLPDNVA